MDTNPPPQALTSLRHDPLLLTSPQNHLTLPNGDLKPTPLYMLPRHHSRLIRTATFLNHPAAVKAIGTLSDFETALSEAVAKTPDEGKTPLKVRYTLTPTGTISITTTPAPPVALSTLYPAHLDDICPPSPAAASPWHIAVSPDPVAPSPWTTFKTTSRAPYDEARTHLPTPPENPSTPAAPSPYAGAEILLPHPHGTILDGSISTPFFKRGGKWVTPATAEAEGRWGGHAGVAREWAVEGGLVGKGEVRVEGLREGEVVVLGNGVRGFWWGRVGL